MEEESCRKEIVEVVELPWTEIDDLDHLISDETARSDAKRFLDRFFETKFKYFGPAMREPRNYIMLFETYKRFLTDLTVGNAVFLSKRMPKKPEKPDERLVYAADIIGHEYDQIAFSETFVTDVLRKMVSEYLETKPKDSEEYALSEHLLETPFVTSPAPNDRRQFFITTDEEIERGSPLPPDVGMIYLRHDEIYDWLYADNRLAEAFVPALYLLDRLPRYHLKKILVAERMCEFLREIEIDKLNEINPSDHVSWPYLRDIIDIVRSRNVD